MAGFDTLKVFSGFLVIAWVLAGCASSESFLLENLSNQTKAQALVETGATQYNTYLIDREDFSHLNRISKIFEVALDYDSSNPNGQRYLSQIRNLQKTKLSENIAEARRLQKKNPRKEEEEFALALAVRKAVALAPGDPVVRKLAEETAGSRDVLIRNNLTRITRAMEAAESTKGAANAEAVYVDAFLAVLKLSGIQPDDSRIKDYSAQLRGKVGAIIEKKLADIPGLAKQSAFSKAKAQLDLVLELNRKLDGSFSEQTNTVGHDLYLTWARSNYDRKDWDAALTRVEQALGFKRSTAALGLRRQITDRPPELVPFDTILAGIDKHLAANKLIEARKAIADASNNSAYANQASVLEGRSNQLKSALKELYAKGLAAYREEKFAQAIELLAPVYNFDSSYEQVADFLQKARDKQKVLNQF